jgi:phosphate transport system substrate-binding protein
MKINHLFIKSFAFFTIASLLALSFGCGQNKVRQAKDIEGQISISGAFALYPMTVKWAEEFQKIYPNVRIDISAGGAGKGMTDVLAGMVDLAMMSREVSQAEIDKGAWFVAVTKDAVVATINADNPVLGYLKEHGMTGEQFQELFLTEIPHVWGDFSDKKDQDKINVYTRSDACGAAEMWGKFLGKNQESLKGIGVFGDPGMADAVKNDRYGLGFNNVVYAFDMKTRKKYPGLEVIPLDINGNGIIDPEENNFETLDNIVDAIRTGKYPSPPARELYLISNGKPTNPAVLKFIEWILTDGQKYVNEAGYVELSKEKIHTELKKIK